MPGSRTQGQGGGPRGQWYPGGNPLVRTYCHSREVHPYLWRGTRGPLAERTGTGNLVGSVGTSEGAGEGATVGPRTLGEAVRRALGTL
jgi:hypothetical protein